MGFLDIFSSRPSDAPAPPSTDRTRPARTPNELAILRALERLEQRSAPRLREPGSVFQPAPGQPGPHADDPARLELRKLLEKRRLELGTVRARFVVRLPKELVGRLAADKVTGARLKAVDGDTLALDLLSYDEAGRPVLVRTIPVRASRQQGASDGARRKACKPLQLVHERDELTLLLPPAAIPTRLVDARYTDQGAALARFRQSKEAAARTRRKPAQGRLVAFAPPSTKPRNAKRR